MSSDSAWASASGFHSSRKSARVEHAHPGRHLEAAGPAEHDEARHAGARESFEQSAGGGGEGLGHLAEGRPDGADGEVVPGRGLRNAGGVGGVAGDHVHAVALQRMGLGVAHHRRDLMPARDRLGHGACADAAARAEDDDPHALRPRHGWGFSLTRRCVPTNHVSPATVSTAAMKKFRRRPRTCLAGSTRSSSSKIRKAE